ncbi:flagellar biosynthesis protein FlgL, partial [Bacillus paranthracis]|nr:flagellar biosynthesis protein FlgL [Bacillus paranthracis]
KNVLSRKENTLAGIVKAVTRADQLTIQAVKGSNGEKVLTASGAEIEQILRQVVYLANTKEQCRYLFGGDSAE